MEISKQEFFSLCKSVFSANSIPIFGGEDELEKYYTLASLLEETNKKMNLTAITDPEGIVTKHIADSLKLLDFIKDSDRSLADIGCGGGFPSLPCAISAFYRFPRLKITGFDSTKKKIDYVNECASLLSINNMNAVCGRAEELAKKEEYREKFDITCARAVSEQYVLSELCLPFTRVGGRMISLKGSKGSEELEGARQHMAELGAGKILICEYSLSDGKTEEYRSVISCVKCRPTAEKYPRAYAKIIKNRK